MTKYLGYFCGIICYQKLLKIAQSGHTDGHACIRVLRISALSLLLPSFLSLSLSLSLSMSLDLSQGIPTQFRISPHSLFLTFPLYIILSPNLFHKRHYFFLSLSLEPFPTHLNILFLSQSLLYLSIYLSLSIAPLSIYPSILSICLSVYPSIYFLLIIFFLRNEASIYSLGKN